jgi:hypothetical protein
VQKLVVARFGEPSLCQQGCHVNIDMWVSHRNNKHPRNNKHTTTAPPSPNIIAELKLLMSRAMAAPRSRVIWRQLRRSSSVNCLRQPTDGVWRTRPSAAMPDGVRGMCACVAAMPPRCAVSATHASARACYQVRVNWSALIDLDGQLIFSCYFGFQM